MGKWAILGPKMLNLVFDLVVLCEENMVSKKSKIVCSVKVSRVEFVSLPNADQLQPHLYNLPCVEWRISKLDQKSTMHSVVKCP